MKLSEVIDRVKNILLDISFDPTEDQLLDVEALHEVLEYLEEWPEMKKRIFQVEKINRELFKENDELKKKWDLCCSGIK